MKKTRFIILAVLLSSLIGYLQWGQNQSSFLFEAEWLVLGQLFNHPKNVAHPLILLPLVGQICLIVAIFLKQTNKRLIYLGVFSIAPLMLIILIAGILSKNIAIILSTIPFIVSSTFLIRTLRPKV